MSVLPIVERVARSGLTQAVLGRPRAERVATVMVQASTIKEPIRFVWRELSASGCLARYRLRRSDRPVFVRHNTADPIVLQEIFSSGHYRLPDHIAAFLDGLGRPPRILDLGANIGLFGVWALDRFPGAEITAFEPDPANAAVARRSMQANDGSPRWRLIEAAATNRDGRATFLAGEFSRSRLEPDAGGLEVETVDVFPHLEGVDLAKVDIEGGEWAIVGDPRFRELRVPVVALEYHGDQAPADDPRAAALEAVGAAGYESDVVDEFGPGQGMLWAWRPSVASARS